MSQDISHLEDGRWLCVSAFSNFDVQNRAGKARLYLVGGLEHVWFFHILGIVIPIDELIFFRGVQTTNQIYIYIYIYIHIYTYIYIILWHILLLMYICMCCVLLFVITHSSGCVYAFKLSVNVDIWKYEWGIVYLLQLATNIIAAIDCVRAKRLCRGFTEIWASPCLNCLFRH